MSCPKAPLYALASIPGRSGLVKEAIYAHAYFIIIVL